MKDTILQVRMDKEMKEKMVVMAKKRGVSVSYLVRGVLGTTLGLEDVTISSSIGGYPFKREESKDEPSISYEE